MDRYDNYDDGYEKRPFYHRESRNNSDLFICIIIISVIVNIFLGYALKRSTDKIEELEFAVGLMQAALNDDMAKTLRNYKIPHEVINIPPLTMGDTEPKPKKRDCWIRDGNTFKECPPTP